MSDEDDQKAEALMERARHAALQCVSHDKPGYAMKLFVREFLNEYDRLLSRPSPIPPPREPKP